MLLYLNKYLNSSTEPVGRYQCSLYVKRLLLLKLHLKSMTLYIKIFISRAVSWICFRLFVFSVNRKLRVLIEWNFSSPLLCWWSFKCRFNSIQTSGKEWNNVTVRFRTDGLDAEACLLMIFKQTKGLCFCMCMRAMSSNDTPFFNLKLRDNFLSWLILLGVVVMRNGIWHQMALFSVVNTLLSYVSFSVFPLPFSNFIFVS